MTEAKGYNAGRRTTSEAFGKNTAVVTLDELQRIRAQCTQGSAFGNTFATSGYSDLEEEQQRLRER
jgi:hypothetical protein